MLSTLVVSDLHYSKSHRIHHRWKMSYRNLDIPTPVVRVVGVEAMGDVAVVAEVEEVEEVVMDRGH